MKKTKKLDQLLKELNKMQMQFDNLKGEMVTKSSKKKSTINTKLTSDKIDNDFFKTLTTAPKINKSSKLIKKPTSKLDKVTEIENTANDLFFSLDIEHEEISNITKSIIDNKIEDDSVKVFNTNFNTSKELAEDHKEPINFDLVIDNKSTDNNKEESINTNIQNLESENKIVELTEEKNITKIASEKSFLSIKQKLDHIKKEIASRELQIKNEKNKVIQLTQEKKEIGIIAEKVLAPKKEAKIEQENLKNNISKKEIKNSNKKSKTNKRDTVDVLTIIILVLLILLIITAWILLK